jgi:hypothetical protein
MPTAQNHARDLWNKDRNLFGNRVCRLGMEEDRQYRRGKETEAQRHQEELVIIDTAIRRLEQDS